MGRNTNLLLCAPTMLACLCAVAPATAVADVAGTPQIPSQRLTEINVSASLLFDSNTARASRQLAQRQDFKLADESVSPIVNVILARPFGPTMLFLSGDGGYSFNRLNSIRNNARVSIEGGAGTRLGQCRGGLTGMYGQSQSDLADLTQFDSTGAPVFAVLKNTETSENITFSENCGRMTGATTSFSVARSRLSNSDILRRSIDNDGLNINLGLGYQRPAFGVLSLFGAYSAATYPNRLVLLTNGVVSSYGYSLLAGGMRYERNIGSRLDATVSVSYTSLTPDGQIASFGGPGISSTGENFSGLTYTFDGSYRLGSRLLFHASAVRATAPSNRSDANYSVNETYMGDFTYRMGPRLVLRLGVDSKTQSYRGLPANIVLLNLNLVKGTTTEVVGSATYRMNRRLSFTLNLSEAERCATPSAFNYSSTTAGLTARATF